MTSTWPCNSLVHSGTLLHHKNKCHRLNFRYSYRDAEWPFLGDKKYFSKFRKLFQKCHYRKVFLANDQKYFSLPRNTFLCLEILFYEFLCHANECAKNYFSVFRITFLEKIISYSPKKHQHLLFCVMPKATCVYVEVPWKPTIWDPIKK